MTLVNALQDLIEDLLSKGKRDFAIYPYGKVGYMVKKLLEDKYQIEPVCVIDNYKYGKIDFIKNVECLADIDDENLTVLLGTDNRRVYSELLMTLKPYKKCDIVDMLPKKVGKHSWGPLCNESTYSLESIGSFCSFAEGACVVSNHLMEGISTSGVFSGTDLEHVPAFRYIADNLPLTALADAERTVIGSDVWLGRNVIICNGAKIGNGVIAAAGAVIVRDVPDYAVVGGIPAKVIKYRYNQEQIKKLLEIRWWDWPDEKIAENFMDFYDIDSFIKKYG